MTLNIQAALGYLGVFIIGYGVCLVRHAIPRGRLPPGGLEAVVNRQHNDIEELRSDLAQAVVRLGRLETANERRDAA